MRTPSNHSSPARILIVDDNPTVHDAFTEILDAQEVNPELEAHEALIFGEAASDTRTIRLQYQADHAMSGKEGIERVRQSLAEDRPYQVAFVDVRMPGMDGVETVGQLWKLDRRIQAVICTAYADYEWQDLARMLGPTDRLLVLKKPFQNIEVMQMASTLARKWFLGRQAALKMEHMESLVARRTEKLLEFHRQENRRVRELDQCRLQYLHQLARQFGGPLTLILNPVEEMLNGAPPDRDRLEIIRRNARSLLTLVEHSSLIKQLQAESEELNVSRIELGPFVRGLVQGFVSGADPRRIRLHLEVDTDSQAIHTDAEKLEKALFHLLSGILAAAVDDGPLNIQVCSEPDSQQILIETALRTPISVQSGAETAGAERDPLTDLDLTLLFSQHLLQLLDGSVLIEQSASAGKGNPYRVRVTLRLPLGDPSRATPTAEPAAIETLPGTGSTDGKDLPGILVVMEDAELRTFVSEGLQEACQVEEAGGVDAVLPAAREGVPDLVIADADPSFKETLKFCAMLKADPITSHIPIILVGAEFSDEMRLDALEAGVDDFVVKPFRLALLKARVDNLLETRRRLHQRFQTLGLAQPLELAANRKDAEFLERAVEAVENHLADSEFDVETLARLLAVSRRQLFRKFKAVAGCTPNVFIRDVRLNHAARLLMESRHTVSEIIYAVGFSDPKYFRTVFRERFGMLPGEFSRSTGLAPRP